MTLGTAIKTARDIKNVTRRTLADAAHISLRLLTQYEEDRIKKPDVATVREIFAALDMPAPIDDTGKIISVEEEKKADEYAIPDDEPEKKAKFGECIYCGQSKYIETTETDQGKIDAMVTWECKCETARAARRKAEQEEERQRERLRRIDNAVMDINNLIRDQGHPEAANVMAAGIAGLVDGLFKKISITIDSSTTVTILRTKDDKIQLEKRTTIVDTVESE